MTDKVVLFVDMLGFSALTESYPVDVNLFRRIERPFAWDTEDILRTQQNRLINAFYNFHRAMESAISLAAMRHTLTSITFSDSAFIATDYLFQASELAKNVLLDLLCQRVPVRIGIAHGSFAAVRFKSDVSGENGEHAAHFLGTGVVRAHVAESCGLKGMRVLLSPSAMPLLFDATHNPSHQEERFVQHLAVGDDEKNSANVSHEIDYWSLQVTRERDAWHSLQDMWTDAPAEVQAHYGATAKAINRMRVSRGCPPIDNLRRRTLPRSRG